MPTRSGADLILKADAMTGFTKESHTDALNRILPRLGKLRRIDQVIAALGN
jgi:hypothetical protein